MLRRQRPTRLTRFLLFDFAGPTLRQAIIDAFVLSLAGWCHRSLRWQGGAIVFFAGKAVVTSQSILLDKLWQVATDSICESISLDKLRRATIDMTGQSHWPSSIMAIYSTTRSRWAHFDRRRSVSQSIPLDTLQRAAIDATMMTVRSICTTRLR